MGRWEGLKRYWQEVLQRALSPENMATVVVAVAKAVGVALVAVLTRRALRPVV